MNTNSPIQILQLSDKYLLASILQKSIRLGLGDCARQAVEKLYLTDKNYLIYRMMIIAFEDIGAGNLELMKEITYYRWGVRNFKERNIDFLTYFKDLSLKLANSPKDRSSCDSVYLLTLAHAKGDLDNVIQSIPALKEIWHSWKTLGFKRYAISNYEKGNDLEVNELSNSGVTNKEEDRVDEYVNFIENITGKNSAYLKNFYSTQVEPFFLSVPILDKYITPEEIALSASKSVFILDTNCALPLSSIDGHTRIGALCIKNFITTHYHKIQPIFKSNLEISREDLYLITKKCLFRVEGQNISQKINYSTSKEIKELVQKKECEYFFPNILWTEYLSLGRYLKQNLSELNSLRINLLGKSIELEPIKIKP